MNRLVREEFVKRPSPDSMLDVARTYGEVLAKVEKQWRAAQSPPAPPGEAPKPPERLPDDAAEQLRQALYAHGAPPAVPMDEARRVFDRATQNELNKLRKNVDELKVNSPAAPPRAMVLNEQPTPHNPRVFLRGDPARPDREVPRRFVQFLSAEPGKPFAHGGGRLEMAQAIASADNPLTARVMVNRVWMHHFGSSLVRTPGDFGMRGEPPSHPQLLDYLARWFIDEGWSLKSTASTDRAFEHLRPGERRPSGVPGRRSGEPLVVARQSAPIGFRGHARFALGRGGAIGYCDRRAINRHLGPPLQHAPNSVCVCRSARPAGRFPDVRLCQP